MTQNGLRMICADVVHVFQGKYILNSRFCIVDCQLSIVDF